MVLLKELTEDSWLVLSDNEQDKLGLLSTEPSGRFVLLDQNGKKLFSSRKDLCDFFHDDIFSKVQQASPVKRVEFFVKGYPINYPEPIEVDDDSHYPLFKKTKISKVCHCAGYYCVRFPKGWIHVFCPKLSTLQKYEHRGPFKSSNEMKDCLKELRKADK
jgi:hypothetical protein